MTHKDLSILSSHPIAHRGLHSLSVGAPENSLAACRRAVEEGFAIEVDIMLSNDGKIVVFHDDDLQRMCGVAANVTECPYEFLQRQHLANTQEGIPTIEQLFSCVGGRVPLIIELKSFTRGKFHTDGELEAKTIDACKKYQGPFAFKSFNPHSVEKLLKNLPNVPIGLLSMNYEKDKEFATVDKELLRSFSQLTAPIALAADFISYSIGDLTVDVSTRVRREKPLMVWTVRTEDDLKKGRELADNIVFEGEHVHTLLLKK